MHTYISFFGINIPSYGLCMTFAVLLCGFLIIKKAKKFGIEFENMIILLTVAVGMSLLCGGLFYILVSYTPQQILANIKRHDFSFITNVGLVFYGGLIGGILGALICSKILKMNVEILERCVVVYIPLGHAIGRIGCLLAGCCHGREYNGIFAVHNNLLSNEKTYFPIQAVEAVFDLVIMFVLLLFTRKQRYKHDVLSVYLILYSIMRFFTEFFRGDEIRGVFLFFSTSQWISIFIIFFCVIRKAFFSFKHG